MPRRALALLVLLVLPGLAASAPLPGADDAGTGADASDTALAPTPLAPGSHTGALTTYADERDVYALDVPARHRVLVELRSPERVAVRLLDAEGRVRGLDQTHGEDVWLAAWAPDAGRWTLEVAGGALTRVLVTLPYALDVAYEPREHAQRIDLDAREAVALDARFDATNAAFLELALETRTGEVDEGDAAVLALSAGGDGWCAFAPAAGSYSGLADRTALVVRGEPTPDLRWDAPELKGTHARSAFLAARAGAEPYRFALGIATSDETRLTGWIAWNGSARPHAVLDGSARAFVPLSEFEGGRAAHAGPYVDVRDARAAFALHAGGTRVVAVDAFSPSAAPEPARFRVAAPGNEERALVDEALVWAGRDAPAGEWRVVAERVHGADLPRQRVMAARFAFDPVCDAG